MCNSQGKDVYQESWGKEVEPVEHGSPPYLNEVPEHLKWAKYKSKWIITELVWNNHIQKGTGKKMQKKP